MVLIISQLEDYKRKEPIRFDDISLQDLEYQDRVAVTDTGRRHQYRIYTHPGTVIPYDRNPDYVHYAFRYRNQDEQPPFRLFKDQDGGRIPDDANIAHQLHRRWGNGCYRIYLFGGQPPYEGIWERKWVKKVT